MENLFVSGGGPTRESLIVIFVVKVRSIRYNIAFILYSHYNLILSEKNGDFLNTVLGKINT